MFDRPRTEILLDACVLLNLVASGKMHAIAEGLKLAFVVPRQVADETMFYEDLVDGEVHRVPIRPEVEAQHRSLEIVTLDYSEVASFVKFASSVDDGEAATLAMAVSRGLAMATDDRKAVRLAGSVGVSRCWTTAELLRDFCLAVSLSSLDTREALQAVERRARFYPPRRDPAYEWWTTHCGCAARH